MSSLQVTGRSRRIGLAVLACSVFIAGMGALSGSASATPTLSCTPSGSTLDVQVTGATTGATPLDVMVVSGTPDQYSVAIGTTACANYSVTTYPSVLIVSGDSQYVLLDDSNGLLASNSAGCPTSISTAGLTGTGNTVQVDGVSSPSGASDKTIAVGQKTGVNGTLVTLSNAAGCSSPDVSLSTGVQTLVVDGEASGSGLDLSTSPGSLTVDSTTSPGTVTGFGSSGVGTFQFSGESNFTGPTAGSTTFKTGSSTQDVTAKGSGNTLILQGWSSPTVNVSGGPVSANSTTMAEDSVLSGPATSLFSGISTIVGPPGGGMTVFGGDDGLALDGQGTGNTLNLSNLTATADIDVPTQTASTGAMTETFTGFSGFVGSATGSDFIATTSNATFSAPSGSTNNTVDLSALPTSTAVNVSGASGPGGLGNDSASGGSALITFTNGHVSTVEGSSKGDTTFYGGPGGVSLHATGAGNTLNLSNGTFSNPVTVDEVNHNVSSGLAPPSGFSGITTFVGASAQPTTFIASTDDSSFTGKSTSTTLDVSNLTAPTVDASKGTVSAGAGATNDTFSGINIFKGSSTGDTTFVAPAGNSDTFNGQGSSGNLLDLSAMGSPSTVNVSGAPVTGQPSDTALSGPVTQTFNSNIETLIGPSGGSTTFYGGQNGITLEGQGSGNTLDESNLAGPETINADSGTVSAGSVTESVNQDFATFIGSASGDTTFITGPSNGTFTGNGSGNELDLTSLPGASATRVILSQADGDVTATGSSVTDSFSDLSTIKGASSVPTTFAPDPNATTSSGVEFVGRDSASGGSVIDLSGFTSPVSDLTVSLGGNTVGNPGHVTGSVGSNPVTFAAFAAIDEVIGSSTLTTGFDPGSASGVQLVNITRAPQAIMFTSTPPSPAGVNQTYTPRATGGGSGDPVQLAIDSSSGQGVCSMSGGIVSFTGGGSCVIDANQPGNDEYQAAPQVQQKITVVVTRAEIAQLLSSEIAPPKGTTTRKLRSSGGSTLQVGALLPGTVSVAWYWLPRGAHLSAVAAASPVLVGRGHVSLAHPGTGTLRIKLTSAGRRLLKHHKRVKLTGRGKFTSTGITPVLVTRSFRLKG